MFGICYIQKTLLFLYKYVEIANNGGDIERQQQKHTISISMF